MFSLAYYCSVTYDQVIRHYGTPAKVAAALGIKAPSVHGWRSGVPALRQYQIELATKGKLRAKR
jgi:DNA-binding transcriptional regulator YdaS (Cro superfamily)